MSTSIEDESKISNLSHAQDISLAVATMPSAFLSVCASSIIIYVVLKRVKDKIDCLGRILVAMSICDIIYTLQVCLQSFLQPKGAFENKTAMGSKATCNAMGFAWQFSSSTYWYSTMLSFYYKTTIVHGWKDAKFAKIEPYLHILSVGYPLATATLGSVMDWYGPNELGFGCWINEVPDNCGTGPTESGEACLSEEIAWVFAGIPIMLFLVIVVYNNIAIYCHVRSTLFRSRRFSLTNLDAQTRRIRHVSIQCFLFVLAFWLTTAPTIALRNLEAAEVSASEEKSIYWLLLIQSIVAPSTGMFNLFVFLRPRYMKCREDYPTEGRIWAFRRVIFGVMVAPETTTTTIFHRSGHSSAHLSRAMRRGTMDNHRVVESHGTPINDIVVPETASQLRVPEKNIQSQDIEPDRGENEPKGCEEEECKSEDLIIQRYLTRVNGHNSGHRPSTESAPGS